MRQLVTTMFLDERFGKVTEPVQWAQAVLETNYKDIVASLECVMSWSADVSTSNEGI